MHAEIEIRKDAIDGSVSISYPKSGGQDLKKSIGEILKAQNRTRMLYASALMNLTSSVELFFSRLLHAYFTLHPSAIGTKEKVFSFDDLSGFDSVGDARAHYILSKIEDLLRGSVGDWIAYAKTSLKLSLGYLKDSTTVLEETFQRRNVIVHNGGKANSIYFSKVAAADRSGIIMGADLSPDRAYLSRRIDLWESACVLIAAELWKQLDSDDEHRAEVLLDLSYKHLLAKRWSLAESLCTFLVGDKLLSESARTAAQLNVWLCKKWSDGWELAKTDVQKADYSAKSVRYQIARLALLDDLTKCFELLPKAISSEELTIGELEEFPIFASVRSDARYASMIPAQAPAKPADSKPRTRKKKPPSNSRADV